MVRRAVWTSPQRVAIERAFNTPHSASELPKASSWPRQSQSKKRTSYGRKRSAFSKPNWVGFHWMTEAPLIIAWHDIRHQRT
jgi:hypothetical protein